MTDIIKQVQEACAAVCEKAADEVSPGYLIGDDVREAGIACCHNLASRIRALDLSHMTGWQDIGTAPKDFVTEFDGWNGERVTNVSWARPSAEPKGEYDWCVSEYVEHYGWQTVRVRNLTHWMPLPAPPKPSK